MIFPKHEHGGSARCSRMKCGSCNKEFTLKEQARAKGCCPSCGVRLPATAYCNDAKARRWYQYHSPMPLSMILAYLYLIGGGGLTLLIVLESVDLGLWTVTDPAGCLSVIMAALIFLLPLFVLFFTASARGWRAKLRGDMLAYEAAVKSDKPTLLKCKACNSEFTLWKLAWKKGRCPSCGEKIPVSEYCPGVPDRRWWRLFRGAPLGLKLSAIFLVLLGSWVVLNVLLSGLQILTAEGRGALVQGVAIYVVALLMLFHMLKAVVRGSIPYVCITALGALGWGVADSSQESLVVLLSVEIFFLSFLLPASRRWARKIREENLSYWIAARSGAFSFRRKVVKYTLKKIALGALLVVCLGTCAYSPVSLEIMCDWVKYRSEEVMSYLHSGGSPLRDGVYYLPRYKVQASTWVEVKKGSGKGEFTIVRTRRLTDYENEDGEHVEVEKCEVEEYAVRQLPKRERMKVLRRNEYSYTRKVGDAEWVCENREVDRACDSVLLIVKDDILIVNGLAYALVRRSWTKYDAQRSDPLPEGRFYPANLDWQRIWVDIKKGDSEGKFIVEGGGSNGAMEPYDVTEYTVRQHPNQGELEILKASEYTYEPRLEGDPFRTGGDVTWQKWRMLIVKGDFLIVDGFVYSLRENWWEIGE